MFDIKWIRENPDALDVGMARRGLEPQSAVLIDLDRRYRQAIMSAQDIQAARNRLSKQIGAAKACGDDASEIIANVSKSKVTQAKAEKELESISAELDVVLSGLPNIPMDDVPDGDTEDDSVEVRRWGQPTSFDFEAKDHVDIGAALAMMDFDAASKMSGARFVMLTGALARMERGLANLMLNTHTENNGYTEVNPPALVNDATMYGTGQLPKFGDDLFRTNTGHWLIPTAEVPLTNIVAGQLIDGESLPRRYTAMTWCFRSEAGSAGKDTRGMLRQHQFTKVEMVSVCELEKSDRELERMTGCAEGILRKLELPYRTVVLAAGDMGFGARKTYDIEVWLPGQNCYREISSCSNCGDFQARRMKARYRVPGKKEIRHPHTLNGSGLAVGRTLIAVVENYQQADGSIIVPEALRPFMGGIKIIGRSDG